MKAADLLLRAQALPKAHYDAVAEQSKRTDARSEEIILDYGFLTEADLLRLLSAHYRTQFVSADKLSRADIPRSTIQMIPKRVAETLGVFPVQFDGAKHVLSVVSADPEDVELMKEALLVSGAREIRPLVARPAAIAAAIRKHHNGDLRAFGSLMIAGGGANVGVGIGVARIEREIEITPGQKPISREAVALGPQTPGAFRPVAQPAAQPIIQAPAAMPVALPTQMHVPTPGAPISQPSPSLSAQSVQSATIAQNAPNKAISAKVEDTGLPRDTLELFSVLVSLLENNRQELRGHSSQVSRLAKRVAERMNLERAVQDSLVVASYAHDLGKMGQFHLTSLNASEYEGHKTAAQKAFDTPVRLLESVALPKDALKATRHMYERFDGKGFPDGLVGREIPLSARILALCDTYADLTQNPKNPFRKALSIAEAMEVLDQHRGRVFDPSLVDLFRTVVAGEGIRDRILANRRSALIIDADPEETTVLELRMIEQAFDVKIARTIESAHRLLEAGEGAAFDLVIAEIDLPDGDGLEFFAEIRKESWGKDLLWMVHTGRQGGRDAQKAFDLGAIDFVTKPVSSDVLVAKAKAQLEQQRAGRGARGVSGSLREMNLADIVQVIFHSRKTGKLNVRANGDAGEIHFISGNVANAIWGKTRGADAFYAMLKLKEGEFGLDPSFVPEDA